MKRIGIVLLLGALLGGCQDDSPCGSVAGTCLSMRVSSSTGQGERVDALQFDVEGDGDLRYGYRWMTSPGGQLLPVVAPLPLPDEAQRSIKIVITALWNGQALLTGTRVVSGLNAGDHHEIEAVVTSPGGEGGTCDDGVRNGAETGIDCGGACPACVPSCTDGIHNGAETDIDCGGACGPCIGGQACVAPADCVSGRCEGNTCTTAFGFGSLSPDSGPTAGGLEITLRGELLAIDMQVRFGAAVAPVTRVAADGHSAVVQLPPGAHGPVDVSISHGADMSQRSAAFAYYYTTLRFGDTAMTTYAPGNKPYYVVSGQFNGRTDHLLDLAVVNEIDSTVVLWLGRGDGTFSQGAVYPVGRTDGTYPLMAAVGDFNGDGNSDLVTADNRQPTVSVLLANGDGTFKPSVEYDLPAGSFDRAWPPSVGVADFNGDGIDDVAADDAMNGGRAYVLLAAGDRSGTFGAPLFVGGSDTGVRDADGTLVAGRIDGDTFADLAVATSAGHAARIFLGNGDGTFRASGTGGLGVGTYTLALADLDGDRRPDLISANRGSNDISVLLGNGDGTFKQPRTIKTLQGPFSVAMGDFDGDGRVDLATPCFSETKAGETVVAILLGDGRGGFPRTTEALAPTTAFGITAGDYNGDGKLDLAASSVAPSNLLTILLNFSM